MFIGSEEVKPIGPNGHDHTGRKSVMFPLVSLARIDCRMQRYRDMGYFEAAVQDPRVNI